MNHFSTFITCDKGLSGKYTLRINGQDGGHKGGACVLFCFVFHQQNVSAFLSLLGAATTKPIKTIT